MSENAEEQPKRELTPEEAKAVLEQERQNRANRCAVEVNAALEKYRCTLATPVMVTPDGRLAARVEIVPKE